MIRSKLLTGSILLFLCWFLCYVGLNVGGVIHVLLLFSIISMAAHIFSRNIALKH